MDLAGTPRGLRAASRSGVSDEEEERGEDELNERLWRKAADRHPDQRRWRHHAREKGKRLPADGVLAADAAQRAREGGEHGDDQAGSHRFLYVPSGHVDEGWDEDRSAAYPDQARERAAEQAQKAQ